MRAKIVILLLGVCLLVKAQPPIQKFWALNQCNLLLAKLPVKPTAAYSLRKLSCNATRAIQVRRDADNATQDIGFTAAGDLDVATLNSFISAHGITATGSYNNTTNTNGSFNVSISPGSQPTSTIISITGTMGGGGDTFDASPSVITDGQTITVGYFNGTYTYMNQLTFTFVTNGVTVSQSSNPKRIVGDKTSDLITAWNSVNTTRSMGATYRINTLSLTLYTGNGYVTTWYDQSGNGNNLTQTTAANQPQIVNNGIVNSENGRPTIRFMDTSDEMVENNNINIQTFSAVRSASAGGTAANMQYLVSVPVDQDFAIRSSSSKSSYYGDDNTNDFSHVTASGSTATGNMYVNNVPTYSYTAGSLHSVCANCDVVRTNTFSLSSTFDSRGMYGSDPVSELIVFPGILSVSDRTRLYNDQKNYYSIAP